MTGKRHLNGPVNGLEKESRCIEHSIDIYIEFGVDLVKKKKIWW